jgi:hypothetical protein
MTNLRTNETTARVISHFVSAWLNNKEQPDMKEIAPDALETLHKAVQLQGTRQNCANMGRNL